MINLSYDEGKTCSSFGKSVLVSCVHTQACHFSHLHLHALSFQLANQELDSSIVTVSYRHR